MNGSSRVTQNISPQSSQWARDFCKPSSGRFAAGFVFISYRRRSPIHCCSQTLFGTSLTLADGMFTPAVSVTSAVAGIGLTVPSLNNNISFISIGILVALFLVQRLGAAKLSFAFSPSEPPEPTENSVLTFSMLIVAFVWFALIGATGIYNIVSYPAIFRAFDPSRAVLCQSPARYFLHLAIWLSACHRVRSN
jgi:K+ transporter